MKTLILTLIALVLVFIFLVVTIYGDDPNGTDDKEEQYRQQLNDWQDNDNNLNED